MNKPRVAIIVVNWNNWRDLRDCLRSLRGLTYPDAHVIVVDNGSQDGSVANTRNEHPEVELISLPTNLGFSGGNNVGIRKALADGFAYVMLLNNDTTVAPDCIEPLVAWMEAHPDTGAVGSKIYYAAEPELLWFTGGFIEFSRGSIWHRGLRERDSGQYDTPCDVDYLTGCSLLLRSSVLDKVGLLDESFHAYGEDCDWCLRIRESGYRLVYIPDSKVWHRISASSGGNLSWAKMRRKLRGQLQFFRRHAPWWCWPGIAQGLMVAGFRGVLEKIVKPQQ